MTISPPTQTQHRVGGGKENKHLGGHLKHTTWVPHTIVLPAKDCHSHCHFMGTGNRTTDRQINSPALGASTIVGGGYKINKYVGDRGLLEK